MLKLRKVELYGFKSFCEKTPITFSGTGITCIVGPNGCGKSNVVDAISWVLGEQSHKMLRAERMSDCIFNGTAKRPPMGISEVMLTLVDPELSDAVAKVFDGEPPSPTSTNVVEMTEAIAPNSDSLAQEENDAPEPMADAVPVDEVPGKRKFTKNRTPAKPSPMPRLGEVVVGRRLYRSGQSEYLINGRVSRLRDVQEVFMGIGLGPDSYAIIEQGRIGQILNSKPMDRRAIIEEAAGITMYKTKRRLAETKLEASKINLSRINDIFVEVEKQLASLKRQASKARRYAELREQMRGLLRIVLASKAGQLDTEAARLENLLRDMDEAELREANSVHEFEAEQERLSSRTYELDSELRQAHNLLGQTALDLDRAENRITFNREQVAQLDSRSAILLADIERVRQQTAELSARISAQRESVAALREQTASLEAVLRESTEKVSSSAADQKQFESRMEELRQLAGRLVEESARAHAESLQADETASRHTAAEEERASSLRSVEQEYSALQAHVDAADSTLQHAKQGAQEIGSAVSEAQTRLSALRHSQQETSHQLESVRQELSAERARSASIEQILRERAYTADAVQKLFNASGGEQSHGFYALGLLADYAEVQEEYESAIEQFLREELEYVVVESFDQARAGIALLREDVGGRATFFVDSVGTLDIDRMDNGSSMPGNFIARLDRLVEFREPLGPATNISWKTSHSCYLVETAAIAEQMAYDNPHSYFLTVDGTCYHGRMVSGGRKGEAGPLALKRELRQREAETARLESVVADACRSGSVSLVSKREIGAGGFTSPKANARQAMATPKKALVAAATHQREQARREFLRVDQQVATQREEISRLHTAAGIARERAERARGQYTDAVRSRAAAESESAEVAGQLAKLRHEYQSLQERVVVSREELATMSERLASSESVEQRLAGEFAGAEDRMNTLRQQYETLAAEKVEIESSCIQLSQQVDDLRLEKLRLQEQKSTLEGEWEAARLRTGQIDEILHGRRQSLDELRANRSQRQIEKARNDSDRDYLRQTCVAELNAQPEELIALETQPLAGEDLMVAETNYNEMKARVEGMGPVNMMALEEFQECEQREGFLRRERDDLVASIQNTAGSPINELDQVSRQKFEEAFHFINAHFAVIAFQSLFWRRHRRDASQRA